MYANDDRSIALKKLRQTTPLPILQLTLRSGARMQDQGCIHSYGATQDAYRMVPLKTQSELVVPPTSTFDAGEDTVINRETQSEENTTQHTMAPEAHLYVAPDKASLPQVLNPIIVQLCKKAIDARGRFVVAISGGSLPSFLSSLPDAFGDNVDPRYDCWHVLLADERCVPATDPDNNMALIRDKFLSKVPSIPANQIYAMDESKLSVSTDAVAVAYEETVKKLLSLSGGQLDLALLGFGPDVRTNNRTVGCAASVASCVPHITLTHGRTVVSVS